MKLIYDKPVPRSLPIRWGWNFATAVLWTAWISLWAPLLALAAWPLGFPIPGAHLQLHLTLAMAEIESIAFFLIEAVSISTSCLLLWSCLNYMRFRNVNRRSRLWPTQLEELADYSALLADEMAVWQKARRVITHHDEHGRLRLAEVLHREPQLIQLDPVQEGELPSLVENI